jgi:outer membrane translocation and assembly module TamA
MEIESPAGTAHASGMSRGFGLIWKSPIGPIHADIAYPLDGPPALFIAVGP